MLEIAQTVQQFLHKHDRPHVSLYDEMLQRQRQEEKEEEKRLEAEKEARRIREEEEVSVSECRGMMCGGGDGTSALHVSTPLAQHFVLFFPPHTIHTTHYTHHTHTHTLTFVQHRQIEEEIKRKKAELRERIQQPSDEEEEEDFEVDSNIPSTLPHV